MGILRYREIQWDDLDAPSKKSGVHFGEVFAWGIAGVSVFALFFVLFPFDDFQSTPEALLKKYPRTYSWLNRCDSRCEQKVNVRLLHAQHSCGALYGLYNEDKNSNLLAWRTALDDRLTALGCPGFPRLSEHILSTVLATQQEQEERQEQWRRQKEEQAKYAENHQIERYKQSLKDGKLLQFIQSIQEADEHTLVLHVTPAWSLISHERRGQMNEVLWQKWATIHSLHAPMRARIQLFNAQGDSIGGSFANGNHVLWVE